jgi:hypothetical protein
MLLQGLQVQLQDAELASSSSSSSIIVPTDQFAKHKSMQMVLVVLTLAILARTSALTTITVQVNNVNQR